MRANHLTGSEAPEVSDAVEIDTVSVLVPAQQFRIRASIMSTKDVPLTMEFGLRYLHTVGWATPEDIQTFFGFSAKETMLLLEDLVRPGFVTALEDGGLSLSLAGRDLFTHAESERPQMIEVDEIDEFVGFDLIAFALARKPGRQPYHQALDELPLSDRKRASKGRDAAMNAFQLGFDEWRQNRRLRGTAKKVYSMDEADPGERFLSDVSVPIVFRKSSCTVEPNFDELRSLGRQGSRDAMIASIARHLHSLAWPNDAMAALDLLAECDMGTLSNFRVSGALDPSSWVQFVDAERQPRDDVSPIKHVYGSIVSPRVKDALETWLPTLDLPERDPSVPFIWLRPRVHTWGRGSAFHDLVKGLGGDVDGPGVIMLAPSEDMNADGRELRKWYKPKDARQGQFSSAFLLPGQHIPGSLEVLLDPGRWALVLLHIPSSGELKMPVPVGFLAANKRMVGKIQDTLSAALPHPDSWQMQWASRGQNFKVALSEVQRAFEYFGTEDSLE